MKKIVFLLIVLFFISGCGVKTIDPIILDERVDWKEIVLKDISSGEMFKINDFEGKVVLLESFAVWCPTCKKQQDEIKEFHESNREVVSISLDTDPNEDEENVVEHLERYGYDWRFAVSPVEITQSLITEFGSGVVNAPNAPIVMICEDQNSRFLPSGLKDVEELMEEIEKGC